MLTNPEYCVHGPQITNHSPGNDRKKVTEFLHYVSLRFVTRLIFAGKDEIH
jgi:hypothetical protein